MLRQLRQARTLSQEELAEQLGISRQSVISLEHGEYLPSLPLLISIIRFFDCPIDHLISGVEFIKTKQKGGEKNSMQITPWNPFQAIDRMQDELADVVERSFGRTDWSRALGSSVGAVNIHEDEKEYEVEVQVPGYGEGDVSVELTEDTLTIAGARQEEKKEKSGKAIIRREWESSEFTRTIRFATLIKADKAEAKLENGTLRIVVPKVQPAKPKTTKVTVKKQ